MSITTRELENVLAEALGQTRRELLDRIERLEFELAVQRRIAGRHADAADVEPPVIDLPALRVVR